MFGKVITYLKEHLRITLLISIIVLGIIVVALGYTYAMFTTHVERQGAFTLIVPELNYTVESSSLNEQNQITVEAGQKRTLEISVTNTDEVESHFKLYYLGSESDSVVVSYQKNENYSNGLGTLNGKEVTSFIILIENKSDSNVTITFGSQGGLLNRELTLSQGKELVEHQTGICFSHPNPPVVLQGQIPVVYSKEKSSWVKADTTSEWYDYCNQEWANAVTVTEVNREAYMSAEAGTEVSMDDINTMWVWIPRYEYMYTNLGTNYAGGTQTEPGEIKVNFLNGKSTTPSDSTNYKVHPAFTFGEEELEGLWYAKFETSTTDTTCNSSVSVANCNKLMTSLQVKPNVSSWRYVNISHMFHSARNMQLLYANTYGISLTDSDVHMSKNSEWGAVSYLSQSRYGKYGNPNYEGVEKEIRINNCSSYITGIGANAQNESMSTTTCTTNTYETEKGITSSTTGNITGIYDMSGGAHEYVMGNINRITASSGFSIFPEDKYYDLYSSAIPTTACNGGICYGHALLETASWYSDETYFVNTCESWLIRRYYYKSDMTRAGIFSFDSDNGSAFDYWSSRLVQVPLK